MANNTFEAAYMKLKNGMTLFFQDSGARNLIKKLQTAVSLIHGIPAGGTTDQVLKKASNDDFDVEWGAGGGGSGVVNTWYATCSTAAGTAAKVATSATGDFVLATGNMVRVLFSDTNIQTQPTLSVDGSTAKRIKNITTDNNITTNLWRAGEVVDLVYDGTDFIVSDGGLANGTYYGRTKLSNSTSSASQTTAASSKAVKDTYDAIPAASDATPQDLGTASAGSSGDYSRADHVHKMPTIPTASDATPQDLGTAAAGSSADYSRADHVHNKPSKSDVGLGNVDNVQQYSASNPPPNDLPSGGSTGQALLKTSNSDYAVAWGSVPSGTMYFPNQTVNVASNAEIFRITDPAITTQTVVVEVTFANPSYLTSDVTWTSYDGYIAFYGTCTAATTANVTLSNVETPSPNVPLAIPNGGTGANTVAGAITNLQILDYVYPVGSIYMSVNSTSPASLFGGTWAQLKDRFLLGAGDTYTAGDTGGEATHTLTASEMPQHNHELYTKYGVSTGSYDWSSPWVSSGGTETTIAHTKDVGNGNAHNNMPPYLVVYMWQRTA